MENEVQSRPLESRVDEYLRDCSVGDPKLIALNYVVENAKAEDAWDVAMQIDDDATFFDQGEARRAEIRQEVLDVLHNDRLVSMPGYRKAFEQIR